MYSNMSPSFVTSSDMGGSGIGYFSFLARGTSGAPLILALTYARFQVTGTSLLDSIASWSPLCHGDCRVEVILENLIVFSGVFITVIIPPCLNL